MNIRYSRIARLVASASLVTVLSLGALSSGHTSTPNVGGGKPPMPGLVAYVDVNLAKYADGTTFSNSGNWNFDKSGNVLFSDGSILYTSQILVSPTGTATNSDAIIVAPTSSSSTTL